MCVSVRQTVHSTVTERSELVERGCGTGSQSDGDQAELVVGMQKADAIYQESVGERQVPESLWHRNLNICWG